MVRSKVEYEFIADERKRRETFKKRKSGIFKKLSELKTLCNVEACGIVTNGEGIQTEVWPSQYEATRLMEKFVALPASSTSHTNSKVDQIGFLTQNLSRISKNVDKETRKVRSLEKELVLAECIAKGDSVLSTSLEVDDVLRILRDKIGMVCRRIGGVEPGISEETNGLSSLEKGKQVI